MNLEASDSCTSLSWCLSLCALGGLRGTAGIRGLEVQLDDKGTMHNFREEQFLSEFVDPSWTAVLTCIGGTVPQRPLTGTVGPFCAGTVESTAAVCAGRG
jgi:hypothetical protein